MSRSARTVNSNIPLTTFNQHSSPPKLGEARGSLKRRRDDDSEDLLVPFELIPLPSTSATSSTSPITAYPRRLVSRSQLPLVFLDLNRSALPPLPKVFSSHVASLESGDHPYHAAVLLVSVDSEKALCAVERLDEQVYSCCRLSTWVTLGHFKNSTSLNSRRLKQEPSTVGLKGTDETWWSRSIVRPLHLSGPDKKIKIEIDDDAEHDAILGAIDTDDVSTQPTEPSTLSGTSLGAIVSFSQDTLPPEQQPTPSESFTNVCTNYLDMLYLSKAPLAYFAKGPLSRARMAHTQVGESDQNLHLRSLSDQLRTIILSTSILDKKYKDAIPGTIRSFTSSGAASDNSKTPKRRKSRKFKAGKDGLFPDEASSIKQWWSEDTSGSSLPPTAETLYAEIRTRIAALRVREYLLQLLLILEILAIEAGIAKAERKLAKDSTTAESQSNQLVPTIAVEPTQPTQNTKKPRDLQPLVETIIDRLAIWQSVNSIEDVPSGDAKDIAQGMKSSEVDSGTKRDDLREFCTEIVIPFYAARLGKVAERIARKLGFQTALSPVKQKPSQKERPPRPGVALVRGGEASSTRRSLSRVSTIAGRSVSGQPPTLIRSATDTLLLELQRERSNSPLVNLNSSTRSFSRSSSINHSKMVKEIDVHAPVLIGPDKSKKTVDQELQDAIATLKKPNRGLAVKEYADATESRKLAAQKRPQPSRTQSRVDATPHRATKTKDVINSTPRRADARPTTGTDDVVSSSMPFVPSSAHRPAALVRRPSSPEIRSGSISSYNSGTVMETPSKPGGKYCDPLGIMHEDTAASAGTSLAEDNHALPTFKLPAPKRRVPGTPSNTSTILNTPQKSRRKTDTEHSKPLGPSGARSPEPIVLLSSPVAVRQSAPKENMKHTDQSIYDSLGWDD